MTEYYEKLIENLEGELSENSKKYRKKSKLDPYFQLILQKNSEGRSATEIMNSINKHGKVIVKNKSTITRYILKVKHGKFTT